MTTRRRASEFLNHPHRSRFLEDLGFVVGILLGVAYVGLVEILPSACYAVGYCERSPASHPFPWMLVSIIALCIAPKTVGRASAGRAWEALANLLPGKKAK